MEGHSLKLPFAIFKWGRAVPFNSWKEPLKGEIVVGRCVTPSSNQRKGEIHKPTPNFPSALPWLTMDTHGNFWWVSEAKLPNCLFFTATAYAAAVYVDLWLVDALLLKVTFQRFHPVLELKFYSLSGFSHLLAFPLDYCCTHAQICHRLSVWHKSGILWGQGGQIHSTCRLTLMIIIMWHSEACTK